MPRPLFGRSRAAARVIAPRFERGSPRERGYGSKWDRVSALWRKRNPLCEWCRQEGRTELVALVDHKLPVVDGGPLYDPENLWSLCTAHHGRKAEMEAYARQRGSLHLLQIWCDDPSERPARFRKLSRST